MSTKSSSSYKTYSRDEILAFTDAELHDAVNKIRTCIRDARRRGNDTTNLEIEFCYLDNERQKREKWSGGNSHRPHKRNPRKSSEVAPVKPRKINR